RAVTQAGVQVRPDLELTCQEEWKCPEPWAEKNYRNLISPRDFSLLAWDARVFRVEAWHTSRGAEEPTSPNFGGNESLCPSFPSLSTLLGDAKRLRLMARGRGRRALRARPTPHPRSTALDAQQRLLWS
uniref:Uncharacterized protein n=1 Tax=Macaca nemestrina TaxID=9545 RepID=A0A2K6B5N0_MACNE